jgi:hypothetical protein
LTFEFGTWGLGGGGGDGVALAVEVVVVVDDVMVNDGGCCGAWTLDFGLWS